MSTNYELEYEKSYDGKTLTARPVKGHPNLPTLTLDVTPEELSSVTAVHRTRTMDPSKPGVTAFLFGKPGKVQIVHHDAHVAEVEHHEAALVHERAGEQDILRSAFDRQKATVPVPEPAAPIAEPTPIAEPSDLD